MPPVRIYLAPGMFGFARLAAYDYFEHVELALRKRFRSAGRAIEVRVCEVHPTASIRRRAAKLAQLVAHTAGTDDGPIHIVGHSTGGLDARLVASPSVHLDAVANTQLGWLTRLRSVTTINTPHYGTPLATFFATAKGQQLLYAVSALTVAALKLGAPPLATASALVAALLRSGSSGNVELGLVDRLTDGVVRALDEATSRTLRDWLRLVRDDQGSVLQLTPEAMDLFQAGIEDRPGVRYHCVASFAAPSGAGDWLRMARSPWGAISAALFHLLHRVTSVQDERYPCAPPEGIAPLAEQLDELPDPGANDGVVPFSSMLWGRPLWVGRGDHLDIVGHFPGTGGHTDWLTSGDGFDNRRFNEVMDAIFTALETCSRDAEGV